MSWYKAAQVSVENGSKLVTVVSAEPLVGIRAHDSLEIAQFNGVDIETTYVDPATDDLVIKLVSAWPHATQELQTAQVVPTAVNFNGGAQILEDTKNKVFTHLASYFAFGTQVTGTVTFQGIGVGDSDITVRTIPQYQTDLDALESQVGGSVSAVTAIDTQVNGEGGLIDQVDAAADTLGTIDSTLSGYVTTTEGYRDSAIAAVNLAEGYRDATLVYRNETEGFHDLVEGWKTDVSGYKSASEAARDLAEQYRDEAEAFKDQAGNIVGGDFVTKVTTVNGKALSSNITLTPSDLNLSNVDNTSDADKPISTATQAALDDKTNATSVSNIDNTSDADKPISTATQAALDDKADATATQSALDDKLETSDLTDLQAQVSKARKLALAGL